MEKPHPPAEESTLSALAQVLDPHCPFGPRFFASQLRAFIRDRCPDQHAALPQLEIHLVDGQAFDVCHIVALAPAWLAMAVFERSSARGVRKMRTEIVPYAMIARITVSADRESGGQLGFDVNRAPAITVGADEDVQSAEHAFHAACGHSV